MKELLRQRLGPLLLPWYRRSKRDLPWRKDSSAYSVWVSEIMLQQTRVETVIPYYRRFLERFPTLLDLARASLEDVLAAWSGLGYYRRARSLHSAARSVARDHGGQFPRELTAALRIPGVGPYTAGAVLSIAYNLPVPVVDGNVERVFSRLLRVRGNPRRARVARTMRELARASIPDGFAGEFNQALMELGATVCTPLEPACHVCPLAELCLARQEGDMTRYPELPRGRDTVELKFEAALVRSGGRYLLERVAEESFLKGLWLFPLWKAPEAQKSAKGSRGSEPHQMLLATLARKLGVEFRPAGFVGRIHHAITFRRIRVDAFFLETDRLFELERKVDGEEDFRWARLEELGSSVPVSSMALKIRERLYSRE